MAEHGRDKSEVFTNGPVSKIEEDDEEEEKIVERDPTGRYGRCDIVLGKGAFKTVFKAFDEVDGIEVAWNQVKVQDVFKSEEDLERLYSEVNLLKTLKHKNIIKFYNSWVDSKTKNVNFITEIFTSGTLRQYRKRHKHCDIKAVKNWSRQILRGLLYLHSHDPPIIHRDLKCDNIFVNGNQGEVKIGDLGLAAILQHKNAAHSVIGTPEFMAPELYEEEYNELVDIYAFGMCVLEMVTFEYPYSECSNAAQIYKKVIAGKKPAALDRVKDPEVRAFVEKCLASASRRLPARELLMDPFLAESDRESVDGANSMSRSESKGEALDSLLKADDGGNSKPSPERSMRTDSNLSLADSGRCEHASSEMLVPSTLLEKLGAPGSNEDDPDDAGGPDSADAQHLSRDFKVKGKLAEDDTGTVFLRLKIADSTGHVRNIHFPFSTTEDTAFSVASEMVEELDLTDQDVSTIAEMIDAEILKLVPDWKPGLSLEDDDGEGEGGGHATEEGGQSLEDVDQEVEDNPASLNTIASDTSLSAHASERDRSASPPRSRSRSHSRTGLKGHGRSFSPPSSGNFVGGFSPPTGDGFGVIHGRFWEGVPGKFADGNVGFSSDDSDGKEDTDEGKGDKGSVDQDVSASAAHSDTDGEDVVSDNINEFTVHSASGEKRFSSDDMQLITGKWEGRGLEREESNNSYGRRSLTDFREVLDMRDKGPFRKISSDEWPGSEGGIRPGSHQSAGDLLEEEADDELQRQLEELERQRQQEMRDLERKYNQKLNEVRNRHRNVRDGSRKSPAGKDQQAADMRDGYQTDPAWDRGGERVPLGYGKLPGYPEPSGPRWQEYDEYGGGSSGRRGARGLYAQARGDSSDRDGSSWKSGELSRERLADGVWPEPHGGATERYYGDPIRDREGLGFGKREERGRGRGLELGVAAYDGVSGSGPPRERGGWEYRGGRDPVSDRYRGEDRDYRDPRLDREWERDWGRERRGERERVGDRDRLPERERDRIGDRERVMERDRIGDRERLNDRERSGDRDRVGERDWAAEKERALERHVGPEKDRALEKDRPADRDRDRERERERGGDRERDRDKDHRLPERDQKRLAERDVERKPVERDRERGGEKERPSERDRVGDRERDRDRRPQDKDGAPERERDRGVPDRERDRLLERDRDRDRSDRDRERIPERVRIGDRDRDRDWDWERDRDRGRDWGREREWGRDYGRNEWREGGRIPSRHNLELWELGPPRGYGRYGRGDEWDRADYDPRYYPGEAHWGGTRGSSGSPQWDEYGSDDGRGPLASPPRTSSKKGEKGGGAAEELYGVAPHRFDAGHPYPRVRDDGRAGRPEVDAGRYWPSMHSYSGPVIDGPQRDEAYPREVSERPRERYDRREIDKESSDGSVGGRLRERRDAVVEPPAMWKDSSWEMSHKGHATKPLVTKSGPLLGGGSGDSQDGRGGPIDKRVLKDGDGRKGGLSGESSRRSSHGDEPRMRSGVGKELDATELRKSVSERILELPESARDSLASSGSRSTSTLNQLPQAIAEDEGSADDSEEDEVEAGRAVPSRELADAMSDRHEETYADAVKSTVPKAAGGGAPVRAEYSAGGQAGSRMLSGDHRDVPLKVVEGHASGATVKREQLQKSIAELEARTLLGLTAAKVPKNGLFSASSAGLTQSGLMALKKGAAPLQPPSQQQQQQQHAVAAGGGNHGPPNPTTYAQQLPAPQTAQAKQAPRPNSP